MYAVIRSGGKQERVSEGEIVRVELLGAEVGDEVALAPVLVVGDGGEVRATPDQLEGVTVTARVVGEELGPKINAMTYKSKSNQRRRWGHRQRYSTVEIVTIATPAARSSRSGSRRGKAKTAGGTAAEGQAPEGTDQGEATGTAAASAD